MKRIYYNGEVYTGTLPLVEAFIEEDGHFTFAGSSKEALAKQTDADELIDLEGKFVCSGFNDSHMHLLGFGKFLSYAPLLEHTDSLADMIKCMQDFATGHPSNNDGWIMGRGWNQDYFTDANRMPNRYDLDQVSTDAPVCAVRACGHCLVVNSKALSLLGIDGNTPQPDGGHIGMENGIPDGRFYDNAMDLIYSSIPAPDKAHIKSLILTACRALNSYGITSCQTDDYSSFHGVPWTMINEAYKELEAEGLLSVRIYEQSNFPSLKTLKEFVEAGNVTGTGSDRFKIGPLKMIGDGSLGARTAFLSRPYADDPSTCGISVFTQEAMDEMVSYANSHGMQVAIHAIGDGCLDRVLNAYEKALKECPRDDHRHGIVHCQISRKDQLEKIVAMNLHVYAQGIFLDYDIHVVEERVGKELASTSYSWKTLMEMGATVSNSTDCPIESPDVLACIQCTVTRKTLKDHIGPYLYDQRFTIQEALNSYTSAGAFASFEENDKGRIAPQMAADFVILGENPFSVAPESLKDIPVKATYLAGVQVYSAKE